MNGLPGRALLLVPVLALAAVLVPAAGVRAAPAAGSPGGSWTVYHHDPAGSGVAGPVARVRTGSRAWTSPALDGQLYGEPLIWSGRVYVAPENNTVYALSARTGRVLWSRHLAAPVPAGTLPCGNISPVVGITGTPVLDPARREIFAVADELRGGHAVHVLVGLSAVTGAPMLSVPVDPAGADPTALLQRTGLTLDAGRVVFGFGGNFGDCAAYRGRVVSVPEGGGRPAYFTVDAGPGQSQGSVWMGGGAPAVDAAGHVWVSVGNGSVHSSGQPYDHSDSVLELTATMALVHFFAPASWAQDNAADLDLSTEPALLPGGQVVAGGKASIAWLLSGTNPGGIGGQQAALHQACAANIDGGNAVSGRTVFLPCLSGIVAVRASSAPPGLRVVWTSRIGGGPPVLAAGLVWTISLDGVLSALDPATGRVLRQARTGAPANHFPTPAVGDGVLAAASARQVVAFAVTGRRVPAAPPAPSIARPSGQASPPGNSGAGPGRVALVAGAAAVLIVICGLGVFLARRRSYGARK
jgi:outer membrane protein assembly factor BamB